jgi:hypothetical protein
MSIFIGTDPCIYFDGEHVYAGKGCSHVLGIEDEMGTTPAPGWTAQQGPATERPHP